VLEEAVKDAGISAERLEIELTESAAMVDYDHTRRTFTRLRDMGFSIAIDDFGTGYASMSYLRRLPFNKLKIDREFVTNVDTAADSQAICGAMIALSKGLGLEVLAEGAERPEEVRYLSERGCNLFQGYYFAKPVAAAEMGETLADIDLTIAGASLALGRSEGVRSAA
jgi:EAL domain-containing protein (putative c-di-GMP-specific phosphodiesterase class I)